MADNVVEVVITGKDDTGAAYTSAAAEEKAFADLTDKNSRKFQQNWDQNARAIMRGHDALLMAQRAEMDIDREARKLDQIERDMNGSGRGGFLTRLLYGSDFAGGGSSLGGMSGLGGGGMLYGGIAAAIPTVLSLSAELTALTSGFAAAGAGAGAFYALSHNAFTQLQSDVGKLQSGQVAVQLAQNMEKLYPSAAHLKALDTAREKLKALTMSMGQDAGPAAQAMQAMGNEWHKLQAQFAPTSFRLLGDAFKTITAFMPALIPLANAFAGALEPMLKQLGQFAKSQGFQDWLKKFTALVGPSTTAIGHGIALLVSNFGRLLTLMSAKDVVNGINIAFRILNGTLGGFIYVVQHTMMSWDQLTRGIATALRVTIRDVTQWYHDLVHWFEQAVNWVKGIPHKFVSALASLPGMLFRVGQQVVEGLIHGLESMAGSLVHAGLNLASSLWHSFTGLLGIGSPSRVFHQHGRDIVQGLVNGINQGAPDAIAAMRKIGLGGLPGGVPAFGGGGGLGSGAPMRLQLEFTGSNADILNGLMKLTRISGGDARIFTSKVRFQ